MTLELPFAKGSETSKAAAESLQGIPVNKLKRLVLEYIVQRGAEGATCDQAELDLGMRHQTCSARFYDLHKLGAIVDSGMKRRTRSRRNAVVYVAVGFGK
jgi:hypothetical protein